MTLRHFMVQWHITVKCGNRCRHCYMFDPSTYEMEKNNELNMEGLRAILDSIESFEKEWDAHVDCFVITGGDPLLREDWRVLLRELVKRKKTIHMMGNPETLTDENLEFLQCVGLRGFQLSLDGLMDSHDRNRGKGSFARTLEGINRLNDFKIPASVMFTLTPENRNELVPLMEFVATETPAAGFSFDIVSSVGNATQFAKSLYRESIRTIFREYIEKKRALQREGRAIRFSEKSHLFQLAHFELSEFYPVSSAEFSFTGGCSIGWGMSILSDGTVLACRRFPLKVGKMPEQSFEEILLGSPVLKKFRRQAFHEGCGACDFFQSCRGCPAVTWGLTGNPLSAFPLCYRKDIPVETGERCGFPPVALETSYKEEYDLMCRHFFQQSDELYREFLKDEKHASLVVSLCWNPSLFALYMKDPGTFFLQEGIELKDRERVLLNHILFRRTQGYVPDEIIKKLFSQINV